LGALESATWNGSDVGGEIAVEGMALPSGAQSAAETMSPWGQEKAGPHRRRRPNDPQVEAVLRRSDKEITDRSQIDRIIRGSQVCRLGFALNDEPYVVPLSFGYDGEALYFHTARRGKKIDFISANPRVCFELERNVQLLISPDEPCSWSFSFESVVGYGTISELTSHERKAYGLSQIVLHCSGREWGFGSSNLDSVRVWRLTVESVTGKLSRPKRPESP
jgi:hypothetical protein